MSDFEKFRFELIEIDANTINIKGFYYIRKDVSLDGNIFIKRKSIREFVNILDNKSDIEGMKLKTEVILDNDKYKFLFGGRETKPVLEIFNEYNIGIADYDRGLITFPISRYNDEGGVMKYITPLILELKKYML